MFIDTFSTTPFLGILRGIKPEQIAPLVDSLLETPLKAIEITLNTPDALPMIEQARRLALGALHIGAGTVLSPEDLQRALDAGAEFIVAPILEESVVTRCVATGIAVFPGAFTPQEVYRAHRAGATMIKLFPGQLGGPSYLKELRGPFREIPLLACGGVNEGNVAAWFQAGATAVAFGGSLFDPRLFEANDYRAIQGAIRRLIEAAGR